MAPTVHCLQNTAKNLAHNHRQDRLAKTSIFQHTEAAALTKEGQKPFAGMKIWNDHHDTNSNFLTSNPLLGA